MIDNEDAFWYKAQIEMEKMLPYEDEDEKKPKQKYNKEYAREYYQKNKEIIKERCYAYYLSHKEKFKQATYEYMRRKIICECGAKMIYNSKYRHLRSTKHFTNLKKILENKDGLSESISETS
jgi:hypothetical protein